MAEEDAGALRKSGGRDTFHYSLAQWARDYGLHPSEPLSAAEIAQAAKDVANRVLTFEPPPDEPDAKFVDVGPRKKLTNMLRPDGSMEIENLLHNIRSLFGVTDGGDPPLTAAQQVAIPHILLGTTDVSLVSRRAGGKTLAFAAPVLHKVIRWKRAAKTMREKRGMFCLVVTPTAVVCSQVAALFAALAHGTGVSVIHSSNKMNTSEVKTKMRDGCNIFVCDLARLDHHILESMDENDTNPRAKERIPLDYVRFVVLDQSQWMIGEESQVGGRAAFRDSIEPLMMCLYANEVAVDYRLVTIAPEDDDRWYKNAPDRVWGRLKIVVGADDERNFDYKFLLVERERKRIQTFTTCFEQKLLPALGVRNGRLTRRMLVFVASAGSAYDVTRVIEQAVPGEPVESIASNFTPQHVHSVIAKVSKGDCNVLVVVDGVLDGTHLPDFHFCVNYETVCDFHQFGFFANRLAMCGRISRRGTIVTLFNPEQDHVADELAFAIPRAKLPDFVLAKVQETFKYDTQNHPHFVKQQMAELTAG